MPAAAVIPAPIVYISVVVVKTLVVGFWAGLHGPPRGVHCAGWSFTFPKRRHALHGVWRFFRVGTFTLNK